MFCILGRPKLKILYLKWGAVHEGRNVPSCYQNWCHNRTCSLFNVVILRIFSLVAGMVQVNLQQLLLTHLTLLFSELWSGIQQSSWQGLLPFAFYCREIPCPLCTENKGKLLRITSYGAQVSCLQFFCFLHLASQEIFKTASLQLNSDQPFVSTENYCR